MLTRLRLVCWLAMSKASASAELPPWPEAQAMSAPVLEGLQQELPATTFDTRLKETEGLRCDGDVLVVRVPSADTVAWLEQRLYRTILKSLQACSGPMWDVRVEASEAPVCPVHGCSGPAG